jgi:hypothetical protein
MLFYRATAVVVKGPHLRGRDHQPPPDLDRLTVGEAERRAAGTAALVYLRKGETFAELAAGSDRYHTAWRYANETVALLAAWAPNCAVRPGR